MCRGRFQELGAFPFGHALERVAADGDAAEVHAEEGDDDDGDDGGNNEDAALESQRRIAARRAPRSAGRSLGLRLISGRDLCRGISLLNNDKKPPDLDGLAIARRPLP